MLKKVDNMLIRIILGALFFVLGIFISNFSLIFYLLSYIILSYDVLWGALEKILKRELFDEEFLMSIATIGAIVIKEYPEAVAVMLFFQLGEYIQDKAVDHSRKSISSLVNLRSEVVHVVRNNKEADIDPKEVKVGDIIYVHPGEKVNLDGIVVEGDSMLDMSALTGEIVPIHVSLGNSVLSGSINKSGLLSIKVTSDYYNSTVSRILKLMEEAVSSKTKTENFITKFSRVYTPIVVLLSLMLFIIPTLLWGNMEVWFYRSLIFLVISCPCALVISIPLGFFSGLGVASRHGILMKGSNHLEALTHIDTVVLDKTGTITSGEFKVRKIVPNAKDKELVLEYAAYAENYSNHPLAYAIREKYKNKIDEQYIEEVKEFPGYGVSAKIRGQSVMVGNTKFMEKNGIKVVHVRQSGTIVHVAVDKEYYGYLLIADTLKPNMKEFVKNLKVENIEEIVILSGDNDDVVKMVSNEIGADEAHGALLPDDKLTYVKDLMDNFDKKVLFMGDGMNDAPVLATSTVGVSMGGIGSDAAIEASDIVLMHDDPSTILTGIKLSKMTLKIVWQNIIFSISIKLLFLLLGALGIVSAWGAVFSDVGVTILAIINSMRILKFKVK